jgi:pyruvate dehydrogenase E2 component (dihydrolipoamide acetyltransferase)
MGDIVMPRLSDTMEEGTVLRWLKQDDEHVQRGEELVEIETDKATMIYESDQDGTLQTVAREGETLPVGQLIARVGSPGDGEAAAGGPAAAEAQVAPVPDAVIDAPGGPSAGGSPPATPASSDASDASAASASDPGRVKASPLARRIAQERGVELRTLSGSGPGGRIVKADVQAADEQAATGGARGDSTATAAGDGGATPASSENVLTAKGETTTVALSRIQQTIARRMAESKATVPDFALQADVDMDGCVKLRSELKRVAAQGTPTYNDMVVKAAALALREFPRANGSYRDGTLQLHSRINVGVAVAADDALVVPTVFDAEEKSLGEIARETRALASKVRDATITPPELGGGTFTVSNLGMYGISSFTAIINPPQAAILSVGSVEPRAVVREGELLVRHTMTLTLVCDHRILYGADAALFLARIRELLEAPTALTL